MSRFRPVAFSILCLLIASIGCSGTNDPRKFGKVSGKVTASGTPLPAGPTNITFMPANGQKGTAAEVGADGTYAGQAVIGPNKVTINTHGDALAKVDKKYASTDTTPLTTDIKEGENTFDVDLVKYEPAARHPVGFRSSPAQGLGKGELLWGLLNQRDLKADTVNRLVAGCDWPRIEQRHLARRPAPGRRGRRSNTQARCRVPEASAGSPMVRSASRSRARVVIDELPAARRLELGPYRERRRSRQHQAECKSGTHLLRAR